MKSYIVDAFTQEPFKGNQAAVCFPQEMLSDEKMLKIAQEFNYSETAFVRETGKPGTYTIRYFSPKMEIPLCGHATIASSKVVFDNTDLNELHFITGENLDLFIKRRGDEIVMEFPVYDTSAAEARPEMLEALRLTEVDETAFCNEKRIFILQIADAGALAALSPDFEALLKSHNDIRGVVVTALGNNTEYDFHYRYFWPWSGTNEDPVTGGIQTFLAKYWGEKLGKKKMMAYQPSARTGQMSLELMGNTVLLAGHAVIIFEGNLVSF